MPGAGFRQGADRRLPSPALPSLLSGLESVRVEQRMTPAPGGHCGPPGREAPSLGTPVLSAPLPSTAASASPDGQPPAPALSPPNHVKQPPSQKHPPNSQPDGGGDVTSGKTSPVRTRCDTGAGRGDCFKSGGDEGGQGVSTPQTRPEARPWGADTRRPHRAAVHPQATLRLGGAVRGAPARWNDGSFPA